MAMMTMTMTTTSIHGSSDGLIEDFRVAALFGAAATTTTTTAATAGRKKTAFWDWLATVVRETADQQKIREIVRVRFSEYTAGIRSEFDISSDWLEDLGASMASVPLRAMDLVLDGWSRFALWFHGWTAIPSLREREEISDCMTAMKRKVMETVRAEIRDWTAKNETNPKTILERGAEREKQIHKLVRVEFLECTAGIRNEFGIISDWLEDGEDILAMTVFEVSFLFERWIGSDQYLYELMPLSCFSFSFFFLRPARL